MSLVGRMAPAALEKAVLTHLSTDGATSEVSLGELWSASPALLVFLRHLACPGCSEELTLISPHMAELADLGVRVGLITSSAPERLVTFSERMKLDGGHAELMSDPTLAVYRAAQLSRSSWATYGPRTVIASLRLYALGHFVTRAAGDGDVTQQGGALLIDKGGRVLLHHIAHDLADHTPIAEVMDLCLGLAAARVTGWA